MPTFRWSDLALEAIDPEHSSAVGSVYQGASIEVTRVDVPGRDRIAAHATPHEAVHSILRGPRALSRRRTGEGRSAPGRPILVRANVRHSAEILDDLEVVSVPRREAGSRAPAPPIPRRRPSTRGTRWSRTSSRPSTPSSRGPTLLGDRMEVVYMYFPAGTEGKLHSHPNEQLQVVLQGKAIARHRGRGVHPGAGPGHPVPGHADPRRPDPRGLHGAQLQEHRPRLEHLSRQLPGVRWAAPPAPRRPNRRAPGSSSRSRCRSPRWPGCGRPAASS